jgi:hypothetical protein
MHRRTKLFARRFNLEHLENRALLTGNVTATPSGTGLTITGDAAANDIQVSRLANGNWQVKGIALLDFSITC